MTFRKVSAEGHLVCGITKKIPVLYLQSKMHMI